MTARDAPDAPETLSSRLEVAVSLWRARLREQMLPGKSGARRVSHPHVRASSVEAALREQLVELEDATSLEERELAREAAACMLLEERAMAAISRGDDGMARDALRVHARHAQAAAEYEADLIVLRVLRDECRLAVAIAMEQAAKQVPEVDA